MAIPNLFGRVLQKDYHAFLQRAFLELNPTSTFEDNWHLELLASKLEDVRANCCRRLIINLPPRSLKSHCVSIAFVAYLLGHDPTQQVMTVSYNQELADKLARDCRTLMTSDFYQKTFSTRLSPNRQAVSDFETTEGGFRLSASVGGGLTGRANFIIIDDPSKSDEVLSGVRRAFVNDWCANTAMTRLNDRRTGAVILVMQRLHEDDLAGHLLRQGGWEVLSFPAVAEQKETFSFQTPYGLFQHTRHVGDLLHEARQSVGDLERVKVEIGTYNYAGQYQQSPAPLDGGLVKREWLRTYEPHELPSTFDMKVQSWDCANAPTDRADFTVCTTWGVADRKAYLLDVYRARLDYPSLKRTVLARMSDADIVLIENKASGTQLIQELVSLGHSMIKAYEPVRDKLSRLHVQTAKFENGVVLLPRSAFWLDDYTHELVTFPRGRFDDQVDSTAQALDWIFANLTSELAGWMEFYRRKAEKVRGSQTEAVEALVVIEGPSSIPQITLQDGRKFRRGADGLFRLPRDVAERQVQLARGWRIIST